MYTECNIPKVLSAVKLLSLNFSIVFSSKLNSHKGTCLEQCPVNETSLNS